MIDINTIKGLFIFILLLCFTFLNGQSNFVVSQNGNGHFTTIQEAVDNSNPGDIITITPGVYYENIKIIHGLHLEGENAETTIIDGQDTMKCISVRMDSSIPSLKGSISNLTIRNSGTGYNDGVGNTGVLIKGTPEDEWDIVGNIFYNHPSSATVSSIKGTIINNIYRNCSRGLFLTQGSRMDIINNTFVDNSLGIFAHNQTNNVEAYNNLFINNTAGLNLQNTDFIIDYNLYWNNSSDCSSCSIGNNSLVADPLFLTNSNLDFYPSINSPVINAGMPNTGSYNIAESDFIGNTRIQEGRIDIGAFEFSRTTSTKEISKIDVKVFPNPTSDIIHVDYDGDIDITLSSLNGLKLLETTSKKIDTSNFLDGIYLLKIFNSENQLINVTKILKN